MGEFEDDGLIIHKTHEVEEPLKTGREKRRERRKLERNKKKQNYGRT